MLKLFKNKKAQNTAEYAILIALVVGGIIAMQTYVQRAMQGRFRDASVYLQTGTANAFGSEKTQQYEAYYTNTASNSDRQSTDTATTLGKGTESSANTQRTERQEWNGAGSW